MPLATIIETGNHIAQANGDRYSVAQRLAELMIKVADEESPWESFSGQIANNWSSEKLKELAVEWP